jgi:hypothetical protein
MQGLNSLIITADAATPDFENAHCPNSASAPTAPD